jgi:hypothetical protein
MEVTDSESLVNFQGRPASLASWKTVLTICLALVAGVLADDAIKTAQNPGTARLPRVCSPGPNATNNSSNSTSLASPTMKRQPSRTETGRDGAPCRAVALAEAGAPSACARVPVFCAQASPGFLHGEPMTPNPTRGRRDRARRGTSQRDVPTRARASFRSAARQKG